MAKITPKKVKTGNARSIVFGLCSLGFFGALLGGIGAMYKMDQREVEIVKFSKDVGIGTEITDEDIQSGTILTAEYNDKANSTWVGNDGKSQSGQIYIKWDNRKDILGMYVTNARRIDDAVTLRDLSDIEIEPNPWYSEVPVDNELYTLKFDASDIYTRMLLPGCTIRMRVITEVPSNKAEQYRAKIKEKSVENVTTSEDGEIEDTNGYMSAILPYLAQDQKSDDDSESEVPVAEVVFNNLVMLDALNSDGESIFDIYYALNNMDSTVRENYIRENASTLKSRLLPASLIMSLTPEQADSISEFENADITNYKYTIVKTDSEDEDAENYNDLYDKFLDISTRINTITLSTSEED